MEGALETTAMSDVFVSASYRGTVNKLKEIFYPIHCILSHADLKFSWLSLQKG